MTKEIFIVELKKINIILTEEQLQKLERFYEILVEYNQKINLTRITEKEDVYLKHFYDSLTLSKAVDLKEDITLCDVGSGAGFPGIVLKIVYPNLNITLIDSLLKRVNYLNEVINKLELTNIKAIHIRAEDCKEKFDIVTSRAVANLEKLITYCMPLVKENGKMIAMKANVDNEINVSKKVLNKYKCKIKNIEEFKLPIENSTRTLVTVENL